MNQLHRAALVVLVGLFLLGHGRVDASNSDQVGAAIKNCLASGCHDSLKQQRFVHPPMSQGDCLICHETTSNDPITTGESPHPKFPARSADLSLCGQCHQEKSFQEQVVHAPFRGQCTVCHNPHGGNVRYFLVNESVGDLCMKCHEDLLKNKSLLHAPVALKTCQSCHTPHTSEYDGLLARPNERLCVFCHFRFEKGMDQAVSFHEPARKACQSCHDPHGGNARGFLPATQIELCQRCHAPMIAHMQEAKYSHRLMIEGKLCSDCHDAHWSASSKLLKRPSSEICLSCHTDSLQAADGRTLPPVGRQIASAKYLHGPLRQHDCTSCHAAHGSDDPRLMKLAFPKGFYASYSEEAYALCFGCHDPKLVKEEFSQATGFRDGDRNLHYTHVHQEKGRSCRACHSEHVSNNPFHIRDEVPFGSWSLKIAFKQLPDGGTCLAGCHRPRSYYRIKPVGGQNAPLGAQQ
ncbi:MAG: cytochrome c3 family protein [bacterium]